MPYVNVPNDLSKIKTKIAFNLTKRQVSDYELRPAPDNPDRPRSIREQMRTAAKLAEADRGQAAPKKNAPDRGDR